jgi:hypothetical protein
MEGLLWEILPLPFSVMLNAHIPVSLMWKDEAPPLVAVFACGAR